MLCCSIAISAWARPQATPQNRIDGAYAAMGVDARLGIVTDLYVPGAPVSSNAMVVALVKAVEKWGIKPERFAGGHGSTGPYADVIQAAQKSPAGTR